MTRRMPLEVKLPLLMSAILALVLAVAVMATYVALRGSAIDRARGRVDRATRQLAIVASAGVTAQRARYLAVANDSLVRRALRGDSVDPRPALARASQPNDSGMPVELWTADGRRVAFVGNDVRAGGIAVEQGRPELPAQIARSFEGVSGRNTDSLRVGPLYGEDGRVHFWLVMPVREQNRLRGYITHQRRIAQNAQTARTLRELSGDSVSLYYRNADGSFWAGVGGVPMAAHVRPDSIQGTAFAEDGQRLVVHEERIGSTPLVIGMSIPHRAVVSRASAPARSVLLLSLFLLVAGGLVAWVLGRNIVRPLGEITQAAEMLSTGNFAARVPVTGDQEVRRLAASFNHMAAALDASRRALEVRTDEATAANKAKSEFLTTMSHELRTPLNAIGGYVDLLDMELRGPLTPAQKRDLERIKASQQHLLGLISGVLDLARVESGTLSYDLVHVALDPFLASIDALIEPQTAAKRVHLEYVPCPPDLAAVADREKLRQILLNLLSNAIKHTPADGRVALSARPLGGRVQIIVADTGPGIPDDKRDEIFEPFVQLDRSLAQPGEGLGLGLAISRDLARGMSGELTVERYSGDGATFVLTLNRGNVDEKAVMSLTGEAPIAGTRD